MSKFSKVFKSLRSHFLSVYNGSTGVRINRRAAKSKIGDMTKTDISASLPTASLPEIGGTRMATDKERAYLNRRVIAQEANRRYPAPAGDNWSYLENQLGLHSKQRNKYWGSKNLKSMDDIIKGQSTPVRQGSWKKYANKAPEESFGEAGGLQQLDVRDAATSTILKTPHPDIPEGVSNWNYLDWKAGKYKK